MPYHGFFMARILMAWELGAGLGHLLYLRRVAEEFLARGHEIHVASRHPASAEQVFGCLDVKILSAPYRAGPRKYRLTDVRSFAELLYNVGFGDFDDLHCAATQWRNLIQKAAPDVLYLDHSPTAMLAARGLPVVVACQGNGFLIPPIESPLPPFHVSIPVDDDMLEHEATALASANRVLDEFDGPCMKSLADLYGDADERILTTFPEFDPYAPREDAQYVGVWPLPIPHSAEWPMGGGRMVLVYVSSQAASGRLFNALLQARYRALVVCPYLQEDDVRRFQAPYVKFVTHTINLSKTLMEADLCIASGATTSEESVLAGTPVLRIPTQKEQYFTALRMEEYGAGIAVSSNSSAAEYVHVIEQAIQTKRYTDAAESFADQHSEFDAHLQVCQAVERLEERLERKHA